jgi:DnaK suppressor protein
MDERELEYLKNQLYEWLDDLLNHAGATIGGMLELETGCADYLDRALAETDRSTLLRICDRESMLINKIRNSLDDIENGDYGICEECGGEIAMARLMARPIAKHCIRCKTRQEMRERVAGF